MRKSMRKKNTTTLKIKPENVMGIEIENNNQKRVLIYTNDILLNLLNRDARKIAKSFDKLCQKDLEEMSAILSRCLMYEKMKFVKAYKENDELSISLMNLLWNACTSFSAAVLLLRSGFRLQPGMIVRNNLETISLALFLFSNQDEYDKYKAGKIQSSKTISTIKKLIPPFGGYYGFFSEQFAHIGTLQQEQQAYTEYSKDEEALEANLMFLKTISWLLDITSELLCFDVIQERRYWEFLGKNSDGNLEYNYAPSESIKKWLSVYLGADKA
jgi:hypothetical protein